MQENQYSILGASGNRRTRIKPNLAKELDEYYAKQPDKPKEKTELPSQTPIVLPE